MIATPQALEALVARALEAECVAIDTEFVWERTYYPQLGLVQIGFSEDDTALIDTVACPDLTPLGRLLATPDVVKVLHDATQDLTILRRITGSYPKNIFDSRRAAGFVGLSATLSLGDRLREVLGVALAKTETRTNWLLRPLSADQQAYAHDDVRYLPAARAALLARARQRHREAWLHEEMTTYDDPALYAEKDPCAQYLRIGGAGRLSPRQRAVLREVTAWREEEARRRDRPRGHIVADKVLAVLARRLPASSSDLLAIPGLGERTVQRRGRAILEAVARGQEVPPEAYPPPPARPPNDEILMARTHLAMAYLMGNSLESGIDSALVATRAEVADLVAAGPEAIPAGHTLLHGWRRAFAGDELLGLLRGRHAVRLDPETGLPRIIQE